MKGSAWQHALYRPALALAIVYASLLYVFILQHSGFYTDDFDRMVEAAHSSFWQALWVPVDVHEVPGFKALAYLSCRYAPLNFPWAIAEIALLELLSLLLMARILRRLGGGWPSQVMLFYYGAQVFLLGTMNWWAASLHRMPYVLICLLAFDRHLRDRDRIDRAYLVQQALLVVLATSFFEKGVFLPFYLLALEMALSWRQQQKLFSRRLYPLLLLTPWSLIYILWYEFYAPVLHVAAPSHWALTLAIVTINLKILWSGLWTFAVARVPLDLALPGVLLLAGWGRRRLWRALIPALMLILTLLVNLFSVAVQPRTQIFGTQLAYASRYYWDLQFLVAIFGRMLWSPAADSWELPGLPALLLIYGLALAYSGASLTHAETTFLRSEEGQRMQSAHDYLQNLRQDLAAHPGPLRLEETTLGRRAYCCLAMPPRLADVLALSDPQLMFVPAAEADWRLNAEGHLQRIDAAR